MAARALFVGGTSSNAGKSWMVTAICAWLRRRGVRVAPFKAQNMSNHSFPCRGGGEIGRAQVAQAAACGLEPEPSMNPILLKPADGRSQVVVNGEVWKTLAPREYYAQIDELRPLVRRAYEDLASRFEVVVIEGAGSVTELNLRDVDLVNLGLVTAIEAPWMLVADIERGGVFASVIGTVGLLTSPERALFRGFAINKFRGDVSLFDEGVRMLEERTSAPCLGVFPFANHIALDAEDSLSLETAPTRPAPDGARIAIVRFPALSNGTDFRLLDWADWIATVPGQDYDFVILPGTKSTMSDLLWLERSGLRDWVLAQHRRGATLIGICGGFQMLGRVIDDPLGVESNLRCAPGIGVLPCRTVLASRKTIAVRRGVMPSGTPFSGYEIHMGITTAETTLPPFARLENGDAEGVWVPRVIGTCLHGIFQEAAVCREIFGVEPPARPAAHVAHGHFADWFEAHVGDASRLGLTL